MLSMDITTTPISRIYLHVFLGHINLARRLVYRQFTTERIRRVQPRLTMSCHIEEIGAKDSHHIIGILCIAIQVAASLSR